MKISKIPIWTILMLTAALCFGISDIGNCRAAFDIQNRLPVVAKGASNEPYVAIGVHNVGKIGLTVSNEGNFGTGFIGRLIDPRTGVQAPSCVYPYPGNSDYLFAGAFWIGAVVNRDTLVSVGADGWSSVRELWPDPYPNGDITYRSMITGDIEAVSEQDYIAVYTDTVTSAKYVEGDLKDGRPHIPLGIEITQRSYAWSYSYAEDFVLFDYSIKNIGDKTLTKVYMGIYVDGDVGPIGMAEIDAQDDVCGFKRAVPSPLGCGFIDTINVAYIADNDGRTYAGSQGPCPLGFDMAGVTGIRVVRTPSDTLKYSFNWWISSGAAARDFGPRRLGTPDDPFRDFGGYLGTPEGDRNKYYIMRHEEFDYDELYSAVDHTGEGWLPKSSQADDFADGYDTRYLLSFGPFDILPGEVLPLSFAYVAGDNFHVNCEDYRELFIPSYPDAYYNSLDFEELGSSSLWASWLYDNPGVDTDGDGFKGKYRICAYDSSIIIDTTVSDSCINPPCTTIVYLKADTLYYEGDGVPDFEGASPPPAPVLRTAPRITEYNEGEIRIRWNGLRSETTKDIFSNLMDFEGYRVYQSLSTRISNFVLITSYDRDDYNKYIWSERRGLYELKDPPFTLDSLQKLYGVGFDPMQYDRDHPLYWNDSTFYFNAQDANRSDLRDTNFIHKIYPDEPPPTTLNMDSAQIYHPEELTEEGYFKYYEYEYTLRHLLPSQMYYVSVTAFDYGSPAGGLPSLETLQSLNMVSEYALNQTGIVESQDLKVVVYPNPYRADRQYRALGFEGRDQEDKADDRVHRIHFINLPHRCTIRIFSIDGDLVREISHNYAKDDPKSMHDEWDLITRNTQAAVSGIYYYSVESEYGNQIGKLVIIM